MRSRANLLVLLSVLAPALSLAADQRLSDLLLQIERLQQEVQLLRGQVELQQHDISTLKHQLQEQYMDLDARLQGRSAPAPSQGSGPGTRTAADMNAQQAPNAAPATEPPSTEEQAYREAFELLKQRRYEDAMRAFEDLLVRFPNGEFADNARYWLGEANYVKREYGAALTQFQRVLANYPLSPKVPASMLKIGYIHYDQGDWKGARISLRDVVEKFPDSTEARLAESRLERMSREGR